MNPDLELELPADIKNSFAIIQSGYTNESSLDHVLGNLDLLGIAPILNNVDDLEYKNDQWAKEKKKNNRDAWLYVTVLMVVIAAVGGGLGWVLADGYHWYHYIIGLIGPAVSWIAYEVNERWHAAKVRQVKEYKDWHAKRKDVSVSTSVKRVILVEHLRETIGGVKKLLLGDDSSIQKNAMRIRRKLSDINSIRSEVMGMMKTATSQNSEVFDEDVEDDEIVQMRMKLVRLNELQIQYEAFRESNKTGIKIITDRLDLYYGSIGELDQNATIQDVDERINVLEREVSIIGQQQTRSFVTLLGQFAGLSTQVESGLKALHAYGGSQFEIDEDDRVVMITNGETLDVEEFFTDVLDNPDLGLLTSKRKQIAA